jgi:hypothetical protein
MQQHTRQHGHMSPLFVVCCVRSGLWNAPMTHSEEAYSWRAHACLSVCVSVSYKPQNKFPRPNLDCCTTGKTTKHLAHFL